MHEGAHITVVHGGKTIDAIAVKLPYWAWVAMWRGPGDQYASGDHSHGPLGDEHVHWIRGWLYPRLWPPHRKRAAALVVAAALGPPVPVPQPQGTPASAKKYDLLKGFNTDAEKVLGDALKVVRDAERLVERSTRRQVKIRRY